MHFRLIPSVQIIIIPCPSRNPAVAAIPESHRPRRLVIKSSRSEDEDVEEELLNDTQNPDFTAPFDNVSGWGVGGILWNFWEKCP